jgi:hypothetical protein
VNHVLVTLLDFHLCHEYCSSFISPLTAETVIGRPVWEYVSPGDVEMVKTRCSRCLAIGEPQRYWVMSEIGGNEYHWFCRADRVGSHGRYGVIILAFLLPPVLRGLTDDDIALIRLLAAGAKQRQIARTLGASQSAISRREHALRTEFGLTTQQDLLRVALALE